MFHLLGELELHDIDSDNSVVVEGSNGGKVFCFFLNSDRSCEGMK